MSSDIKIKYYLTFVKIMIKLVSKIIGVIIMVKKIKRRTLIDAFIKSWFKTSDKLKVVCKKEFIMSENYDKPDFIEGHAYILKVNQEYKDDQNDFFVIDSNKDIHFIYHFGKKNKFFHKHFDIARLSKK